MSGRQHGLSETLDWGNFGKRSICICGWRSLRCMTVADSDQQIEIHIATANGEMAKPVDRLVKLLEAHQHSSSLTDACTCGAGDMDTLQPSGLAIVGHWRHLARIIEADYAVRACLEDDPDCSGLADCPATLHVHGCPVDDEHSACDTPEAHHEETA